MVTKGERGWGGRRRGGCSCSSDLYYLKLAAHWRYNYHSPDSLSEFHVPNSRIGNGSFATESWPSHSFVTEADPATAKTPDQEDGLLPKWASPRQSSEHGSGAGTYHNSVGICITLHAQSIATCKIILTSMPTLPPHNSILREA